MDMAKLDICMTTSYLQKVVRIYYLMACNLTHPITKRYFDKHKVAAISDLEDSCRHMWLTLQA